MERRRPVAVEASAIFYERLRLLDRAALAQRAALLGLDVTGFPRQAIIATLVEAELSPTLREDDVRLSPDAFGERVITAEASDLGWPPGFVPPRLAIGETTYEYHGPEAAFGETRAFLFTPISDAGAPALRVWND